eukprot:TRINITY_DN5689_c0_g2_i1.p1 TRINITY_DN5689_c0_g2~~TRINITY_DN5689_c0_g2_i1.p1  ORF type:complete len:1116 (-),score=154.62 TRINITY_DN5689_c0_g2_i1:1122-4469(-)
MGKKKDSKSRVKHGLKKKGSAKLGETCENVEPCVTVSDYGEIPEDYAAVIDIVKQFWLTLTKQQQLEFLTIPTDELYQQAKTIQETTIKELDKLQKEQVVDVEFKPDTCEIALEQGLKRMREGRICKEWVWGRNGIKHTSAQEFRQYIVDNHIPEELRPCLPADSATESSAEKSLRKRMSEVGRKVQVLGGWTQEYQLSNGQEQKGGQKRTRRWAVKEPKALYEKHIEVLLYMLHALEKEHGFLQEFVFVPVQSFMREALGGGQFDVIDFSSDDMHRLHQEDLYSIIEWVIEKIEMLSSKWKLDPEEDIDEGDQEENVAEIDLFKLSEDGSSLVVEPKWFDHLADRVLGPDGSPKKRNPENPERQGLVLDWIYGMIVSTAERAREACRHALGQRVPCFEHALTLFTRALQIQCIYSDVEQVLKSLVSDMNCSESSDTSSVLYRNCLAHKARALCSLMEAWTFNKQFKQYRPSKEFDHMQLLLQIMKAVHDPTNQIEGCSSVLQADFVSSKQRQVELISKVFGSKFFAQLNKVIGAYDGKKIIDHLGLMLCFEWASKHVPDAPSLGDIPLLSESDIQKELGSVSQRLQQLSQKVIEGTAALHHLEMNLINLACEDPGALISMHLALPIIQKKLYHAARSHAEKRANAVCEDLITSIEQEELRKEAKRQNKKKKKKPRVVEEQIDQQDDQFDETQNQQIEDQPCEALQEGQHLVCADTVECKILKQDLIPETAQGHSVNSQNTEFDNEENMQEGDNISTTSGDGPEEQASLSSVDQDNMSFSNNSNDEAYGTSEYIDETIFVLESAESKSITECCESEVDDISESCNLCSIVAVEKSQDMCETQVMENSEQEVCLSCSGSLLDENTQVHNNICTDHVSTSSKCSVSPQEKNISIDVVNQEEQWCPPECSEQDVRVKVDVLSSDQCHALPQKQSQTTTPVPTVADAVSDFNGSEDSPIYGMEQAQQCKPAIAQQVYHPLFADLFLQGDGLHSKCSPESSYSRTQLDELPSYDIWHTPIDCLNDTITTCQGTYRQVPGRLDGVLPTDVLVCPITKSFFYDPVVASDGNTYERKAIEIWMQYFAHSPVTGDKLPHKMLIPNHLVRCMIEGIRQSRQSCTL